MATARIASILRRSFHENFARTSFSRLSSSHVPTSATLQSPFTRLFSHPSRFPFSTFSSNSTPSWPAIYTFIHSGKNNLPQPITYLPSILPTKQKQLADHFRCHEIAPKHFLPPLQCQNHFDKLLAFFQDYQKENSREKPFQKALENATKYDFSSQQLVQLAEFYADKFKGVTLALEAVYNLGNLKAKLITIDNENKKYPPPGDRLKFSHVQDRINMKNISPAHTTKVSSEMIAKIFQTIEDEEHGMAIFQTVEMYEYYLNQHPINSNNMKCNPLLNQAELASLLENKNQAYFISKIGELYLLFRDNAFILQKENKSITYILENIFQYKLKHEIDINSFRYITNVIKTAYKKFKQEGKVSAIINLFEMFLENPWNYSKFEVLCAKDIHPYVDTIMDLVINQPLSHFETSIKHLNAYIDKQSKYPNSQDKKVLQQNMPITLTLIKAINQFKEDRPGVCVQDVIDLAFNQDLINLAFSSSSLCRQILSVLLELTEFFAPIRLHSKVDEFNQALMKLSSKDLSTFVTILNYLNGIYYQSVGAQFPKDLEKNTIIVLKNLLQLPIFFEEEIKFLNEYWELYEPDSLEGIKAFIQDLNNYLIKLNPQAERLLAWALPPQPNSFSSSPSSSSTSFPAEKTQEDPSTNAQNSSSYPKTFIFKGPSSETEKPKWNWREDDFRRDAPLRDHERDPIKDGWPYEIRMGKGNL